VTDSDDRVTILQTITAMRADLMTNSNDNNAILKMLPRPNSANSSRSRHLSASNIQSSESSRNSTPIGDPNIPGHGKYARHHSFSTDLKGWELRRHMSKSLDRLTEVCVCVHACVCMCVWHNMCYASLLSPVR